MKMEITKRMTIKEFIDIELPYYFTLKTSLGDDSRIMFGKMVNQHNYLIIHETERRDGTMKYELESSFGYDLCFDELLMITEEEFKIILKKVYEYLLKFEQ